MDSLLKYSFLVKNGYDFDYIIFYHGINETRTNNIPSQFFKVDYTHYSFYKIANLLFKNESGLLYELINHSSLAYRAFYTYNLFQHKFSSSVIATHTPREEWLQEGAEIKSVKSFENNLRKIIDSVEKEKSTLIVPSFAFNIPDNYSEEKFAQRELGYGETGGYGVKVWGLPQNVTKGVLAHNKLIQELKGNYIFIDTQEIAHDIKNFYDPCHFTQKGEVEFTKLLIDTLTHLDKKIIN